VAKISHQTLKGRTNMTSAQIVDSKGNKVREVGLDDNIFGTEVNTGLLHTALVRQLANARRGCASTKTRAEVRGGGRKPWRQKGTGRARAGSIRSPLWEGGGVIFGPKPRDYSITLPKKQRILALKSALASRKDDLVIVQNFDDVKEGKTKEFVQLMTGLKLVEKKVLLVIDNHNDGQQKVARSARNIHGLTIVHVNNLNVKDLLHCEHVLLSEPVLELISNRLNIKEATEAKKDEAKAEKKAAAKEPKKAAAAEDKAPKAVKSAQPKSESGADKPKSAKKEKE
jgi:large subunit ribosomal protein L4